MLDPNAVATVIADVFLDPNIPRPNKERPFLYLLRRDLQDITGREDAPPDMNAHRAPMLAANGFMIGFEMLTKMRYGVQKHKIKFEDMERFLQDVGGLSFKDAEALAQFRHAVTHGYHLAAKKPSTGQDFTFELSDEPDESLSIFELQTQHFHVGFWPLKALFLKSLRTYRAQLEADPHLQGKFLCASRFMGTCHVTQSV